jgi:hypothetical protein
MLSATGRNDLKKERASFIHDAAASTENSDYSTRVDKARSSALEENLKL